MVMQLPTMKQYTYIYSQMYAICIFQYAMVIIDLDVITCIYSFMYRHVFTLIVHILIEFN